MENKPFCVWPWFHQLITTDSKMAPCCEWKIPIKGYTATNFFNSEFMNELRKDFLNQKPNENCQICINNEQTRKFSQRTWGFRIAKELGINQYIEPILYSQEVNLSNLCNLKCRMCDQSRSTKWIVDAVAFGEDSFGLVKSNWKLADEYIYTINRLMFLGGEPLLHQDEICDALKKIDNIGNLNKLTLLFTSNVTIAINNELLALLKKTKKTIIHCSIDSVGKLNEYIRSDSNWEDIVNNVKQLIIYSNENKNLKLIITSVYNVFNSNSIETLLEWAIETNIDINIPLLLHRPKIHDARNLPDFYKKKLILKYTNLKDKFETKHLYLNAIINHLSLSHNIELSKWKISFKNHNDFLDARRHINLIDVNPELHAIINNE